MVVMKRWLCLSAVGLLGSACSSHEAAPPLAQCGPDGCNPSSVSVGSGQGSTGGGGNDDTGAGQGVSLSVNIVAFTNPASDSLAWSLSNTKSVNDVVEVKVPSVTGKELTGIGSSPLSFDDVSIGSQAWASARPTATSIYLPGIVGIAGTTGTSVSVPMLLAEEFSFIPNLLPSPPLSLDLTKAQIAVKIVDGQGIGVRNAQIGDLGAATTAYSNAGSWVDASLGAITDLSGRVFVINLPASTIPGSFAAITASAKDASGNTVTATELMPIEAGFVTYGTIVLTTL